MNIGFIGLGKLGLPCALAIERKGHTVYGWDTSDAVRWNIANKRVPYQEAGAQEALNEAKNFHVAYTDDECEGGIRKVVEKSEIIFVAIQTPHAEFFSGEHPLEGQQPIDFNYGYLVAGVREIAEAFKAGRIPPKPVVVISTVLPGTMRRYVQPLLKDVAYLVYNPFFIAMGRAMKDFLEPEFVLLGYDNVFGVSRVKQFYETIHDRPHYPTTIENAELIKVAYNTFIGMKIAFANTLMEICHKTPGTNVDGVSEALSLATDRLISPAYLRGGMGDGGGCHPRDNLALSWLARELKLSHDLFADVMQAREDQSAWLADLIVAEHRRTGLPICILGKAFKPEVNITTGSPALLLGHQLSQRGYPFEHYDPFVDGPLKHEPFGPKVCFVATDHAIFQKYVFFPGSVVIDPFRRERRGENITYIPVGVGR